MNWRSSRVRNFLEFFDGDYDKGKEIESYPTGYHSIEPVQDRPEPVHPGEGPFRRVPFPVQLFVEGLVASQVLSTFVIGYVWHNAPFGTCRPEPLGIEPGIPRILHGGKDLVGVHFCIVQAVVVSGHGPTWPTEAPVCR